MTTTQHDMRWKAVSRAKRAARQIQPNAFLCDFVLPDGALGISDAGAPLP
jgi:hypothetical protein